MKKLQLLKPNDHRLRAKNADITRFDKQLLENVRQLNAIMVKERGVGIAAPQCGWNVRVAIIGTPLDRSWQQTTVMINPTLIAASGMQESNEGCLSVPKKLVKIDRPDTVEVEWQNMEGRKLRKIVTGYPATVVMHELNHLESVLITDHEKENIWT